MYILSTCQFNSIRAAYREKWSPPNALPTAFQISLHPTWRPIALPPRDSSSATCAWRHFTSLQLASNRMPRWVVCLVGKACCWCWTLQRECEIITRSPPSWKEGLFVQFWMLPKSWIWWYNDEETRSACQKNPSWDPSIPFWVAITFLGFLVSGRALPPSSTAQSFQQNNHGIQRSGQVRQSRWQYQFPWPNRRSCCPCLHELVPSPWTRSLIARPEGDEKDTCWIKNWKTTKCSFGRNGEGLPETVVNS